MRFLPTALIVAAAAVAPAADQATTKAVTGTYEGRASVSQANFRQAALAEALAAAVRSSVDVVAESKTENFAVAYDRVFTKAAGLVKSYKILSSEVTAANVFVVRIEAQVVSGTDHRSEDEVIRTLLASKGSPTIGISFRNEVSGAEGLKAPVVGWFKTVLKSYGFGLVDANTVSSLEVAQSARADYGAGQKDAASVANQALLAAGMGDLPKDALGLRIVLRGAAKGLAQNPLDASQKAHLFDLGASIEVIDANTAEILATADFPLVTNLKVDAVNSPEAAAEKAARWFFTRRETTQDGVTANLTTAFADDAPGMYLLRQLVSQWTAQQDLGSIQRLSVQKVERADYVAMVNALGKADGVTTVIQKGFDRLGWSVIDVLSPKQEAATLADIAVAAVGSKFQLDQTVGSTARLVPAPVAPAAPASVLPSWLLPAGIGAGILLLVVIVILLLRRPRG